MPLSDPGFNYSVLSEFRDRLIAGDTEQLLLDELLEQLREKNLLKGHRRQRTDSTHVLGAIRSLNRLETLGETFRTALNSLTVVAPDWLQEHPQAEWFERYRPCAEIRAKTYHIGLKALLSLFFSFYTKMLPLFLTTCVTTQIVQHVLLLSSAHIEKPF